MVLEAIRRYIVAWCNLWKGLFTIIIVIISDECFKKIFACFLCCHYLRRGQSLWCVNVPFACITTNFWVWRRIAIVTSYIERRVFWRRAS